MPDLKNLIFRFYLKHWFPPHFTAKRAYREQERNLKSIIKSLSKTALGKDLHLQNIKSYIDFAKQVPVTNYSFYEKYIERIITGEQKVMTEGRVRWFGKTAGTTSGKSKLVPITKRIVNRSHVSGTFYGLSRLHYFDKTADILSHKNFVMTGGMYETLSPSGIIVADISAIMMRNIPMPFRSIYVPDNALTVHASWQHKLDNIPAKVMNADVGNIVGVPTWHLAVLNKIREQKPFNTLPELWKNVRFFFHGGVNFEPYRKQFKALAAREDFIFFETYNATEGFFGIQNTLHDNHLLLLTDTDIFYEFIAFTEYEKPDYKVIPLEEVSINMPYVLVITASNGLLRYVIGDVITFTGTNPFTYKITGRTQEYINAFGEDLLLVNVVNALTATNEYFGCTIGDYTVAPYYINIETKGRMQFLIEFVTPPDNLQDYTIMLDSELQKQNSNYAQKRNNNIALSELEVIIAPTGTFYKWLEINGKLGGQNKVPRLVNSRKIIDEVLAILDNR